MRPLALLNTVQFFDAKDLLESIPTERASLIFTDPPYPRIYFPCYEVLANYGPRILADGGSLVSIIPHYSLPEVIALFKDKLKWRWLLSMDQTDGSHSRMAMGIEVMHKPMGWWVKRAYPSGRGFLRDQVKISKPDKSLHVWQQNIDWCMYYIQRLSPDRNTSLVVDPFVGSGTTAIACMRLGLNYIVGDNDPEAIETTRERIKEEKRK